MKYDGEDIKRTELKTGCFGEVRIVYQDKVKKDENGDYKLYFKYRGHLMGTFKEYCYK